jgi:hypothetical protein
VVINDGGHGVFAKISRISDVLVDALANSQSQSGKFLHQSKLKLLSRRQVGFDDQPVQVGFVGAPFKRNVSKGPSFL